jgi:hypothetical protein
VFKNIISAAILTMFLIAACGRTSESVPPGAYAYTCTDSVGIPLVKGWMTIVIADSSKITGEWHFDAVGSPQKIGPQTGDGHLVGGLSDKRIWIELNPKIRNDNLQLDGILDQGQLTGQWTWVTFEGISNQGKFSAVKK